MADTWKSKDGRVRIKSAEYQDVEFYRKTRNENRETCFCQKMITQREQEDWYRRVLADSCYYPYVIQIKVLWWWVSVGAIAYLSRSEGYEIRNAMMSKRWVKKDWIMEVAIQLIAEVVRVLHDKNARMFVIIKTDDVAGYYWYLRHGFVKGDVGERYVSLTLEG